MFFTNIEMMKTTKDNDKSSDPSLWFLRRQPGANQLRKIQGQPCCRKRVLPHTGLAKHHPDFNRSSGDGHRPSEEIKLLWQLTIAAIMLHNKLPQNSVVHM